MFVFLQILSALAALATIAELALDVGDRLRGRGTERTTDENAGREAREVMPEGQEEGRV